MNIKYVPEVIDGEQRQGDTITKYDVIFDKNEVRSIDDPALAAKLLSCPFFVETEENEEVQVIEAPKAAPKKRGRPARVIDADAED